MNDKLTNLENDLDKFYQDIKQRLNALKSPENPVKDEFEEGKWYKSEWIPPIFGLFESVGENNTGFDHGKWCSSDIHMSNPNQWTLADSKEIESLLIEEAKRRFKDGDIIKRPDSIILKCGMSSSGVKSKLTYVISPRFGYHEFEDKLVMCGITVYHKGQWAEVVNDDIIKILGKEVVIHPKSQRISIYGQTYSLYELQILRDIMSKGQVKGLNVGCSGQETIKIDVINSILAKF